MSYIRVIDNAQMWTKILLRSGSISTLQLTMFSPLRRRRGRIESNWRGRLGGGEMGGGVEDALITPALTYLRIHIKGQLGPCG